MAREEHGSKVSVFFVCSEFYLYARDFQHSLKSFPPWLLIACVTDETKATVKSVCETSPKSLFWVPPVYQDLSTRHDYWLIQKAIEGKSEKIFR